MEELPIDIENKIEQLPIVDMNESEEFQKVILSETFNDVFDFYKTNYLPDALQNKSEMYQRVSLYLSLTGQGEKFIEDTDQVLYKRPVPSIEEFLSSKFYMGYSNATLYEYWKEQLTQIFKQGSPVRKVIFSGCIGCLTKDTVVSTLNGDKTIEQLLNNFNNEWVLSYNTNNNSWEPDKIIDVFYTGNRDVYEITLDNGETIKCTENHQFLSRKNKWVSIEKGTLVPGLSMMPYYYQTDKKGYIEVKDNKTEKWINRYKIVGKWKTIHKKYLAIHHKNYIKSDDRPSNLCILSWKEHRDFHAKKGADQWRKYNASISGDEFKEYRSLKSKKGNETYKKSPDYEKKEKIRKKVLMELVKNPEHQKKASHEVWYGKNAEINRKKASEIITIRNKTEKARNTSKLNAENMRSLLKSKTAEELKIIRAKQGLPNLKRYKGEDSKEYKESLAFIRSKEPWYDPNLTTRENYKRKQFYNHKIVSIRYLGKQDVYDITTERNHNFALKAGIVAHNSGKSTVARKAFVYVLYRILCLRYPRAVFGIDNDATIANVIISMSLRQVYDTNLLPFVKLMESMPCFQKVLSQRSFENFNLEDPKCPIPFTLEKSSGTVFFPDNIIITTGSNQGHFTGYNVVNSFCDEINEGQIDQQIAMLNTLDNRFASRFQGSDLVFQSVVSSARSTNSAMGEYIRHLPKNDPAILKLNPMLWTVKPDPNFIGDGTTFPVLVGNGSIPSKIITNPGELKAIEDDTFIEPAGCSLIHVPTIYRSKFELQLDQSIQDIAGITTSDNNMVFRDTSRLEDPQLLPEIYLEANIHDNVNLLENLPLKEMFVQDIKGQWEFRRAPRALRYCHVDLSGGGSDGQCDSGIAIVHKEWKRNEVTGEKETIYVTDLALTVNAKNKIDIHAIQNMLTDLVIERNAPIHTISSDQWNGVIFQQALEASGCFEKVKQVSVDSKLEPYTNAARLIELGHVKVGTCPKLKRELEALILVKNKVTRTTELKDEADAIVGSIYNAQMNYNDVPVYEYETLEEKLARHDKVDYTKYLKDYEEFEELK